MALTLHEGMVLVLNESGGVMNAEELARVIAARDLYRRHDGQHPPARQIRARAGRYTRTVQASDDGSGRITLVGGTQNAFANLGIFCADVG